MEEFTIIRDGKETRKIQASAELAKQAFWKEVDDLLEDLADGNAAVIRELISYAEVDSEALSFSIPFMGEIRAVSIKAA